MSNLSNRPSGSALCCLRICCSAIALVFGLSGCREQASAPSSPTTPVAFAKTKYPNVDYLELCRVPWFVGIGNTRDVITFWEQGIITIAPTGSEGFIPDVYAVRDVERTANGSTAVEISDSSQNPKSRRADSTIIVSPIEDGECSIEYFGYSEKYQTAMKNLGMT